MTSSRITQHTAWVQLQYDDALSVPWVGEESVILKTNICGNIQNTVTHFHFSQLCCINIRTLGPVVFLCELYSFSLHTGIVLFQVEQSKVLIKEGGVQLTLTIVDTPGFGDAVDNSNW